MKEIWQKHLSDNALWGEITDAYGKLFNVYDVNYGPDFYSLSHNSKLRELAKTNGLGLVSELQTLWAYTYHEEEYQFDSLFRTAYKLMFWIDAQPVDKLSKEDKWLYISIFRSQLSWIEMLFFYYNGLTGTGKKFKVLIEKYALFDNLTFDSDVGITIINDHIQREVYYASSAFDSDEARLAYPLG